ncbi:MAG: acyl carrier protein [Verrucomicrobiota bacterium]
MSPSETEQQLIELLGTVLGHPVNPSASRATESSWDSLKHIQIIFAVEEKFNVQFQEEEIPALDSLAKIQARLQNHAA